MADACVAVQWLDENGALLDLLGDIDPTMLRFDALVGHFSTYSFVAVTPVPEPSTFALAVLGVLGLIARVRRRR